MTQMIDILLVLLIVFMAIAPVPQAGLDTDIPRNSDRASSATENPVVLEIAGDGSYRLNSEALGQSSLRDRLTAVFERRADRVLFVKAAAGLEYSVVASAIDTAHGVRIERVALMPR